MLVLAAVPLLASALLGVSAVPLGRRLSGRAAAVTLSASALVCALAAGAALCAVALIGLVQLPVLAPLARVGHVSDVALARREPVPAGVAVTLAAVALGLLAAATVRAARSLRGVVRSVRAGRQLGAHAAVTGGTGSGGSLVVLDGPDADAYALPALPGHPGRTVVTRPMLRALDPAGRRVVLAHEAAHIRHHHWLYEHVCLLAAAANPALRRVVPAVRLALERWADDVAADQVGDRHLAATAVAHAALARARRPDPQPGPLPPGALTATSDAVSRVEALTRAATPRSLRRALVAVLLALATLAAASALDVAADSHALVEWAQTRR